MSSPVLSPGQIVAGKYTVTKLLGSDGAVATYHAITAPNRDVALKLFDGALLADESAWGALARVDEVVATLPEALVVARIDGGIDGALPYRVTSLCTHPSLAQLVLLCPLSVEEMIGVLRSVGRALEHAQRARVAHGALKPTNLFVGPPPTYATRVVDFGATTARRALAARGAGAVPLAWLAPEQEAREADARADVFSAALVAFFAVTGRHFWRCAGAGEPDVEAWHAETRGARVAASARAEELGKELRRELDVVLARALAIEPAARHGSVLELADALAVAAGLAAPPVAVDARPPARRQPPSPPTPKVIISEPPAPPDAPATASSDDNIDALLAADPFPSIRPPPPAPPPSPLMTFERPALVVATDAAGDRTDGDEPFVPPRRAPRLVIAAVAFVLIVGGGLLAFALLPRGSPSASATVQAPAASALPSASASVPASAAAIVAETAPSASAAADPPPALPDAEMSDLTVTCKPACTLVRIDTKQLDDPTAPAKIAPGAHTVVVSAPRYATQTKRVTVRPGEHASASFVLVFGGAGGSGSQGAPSKPCGKFFKRCN